MKKAVTSSFLIPPEWILAHGWQPWRVRPRAGGDPPGEGACPYAWAYTQAALEDPDACLVLTTECDPMRRMAEEIELRSRRPVFLFNMPATWQSAAARLVFRSELERLGRFLERAGGKAPTPERLLEIMLGQESWRERRRANGSILTASEYLEWIATLAGAEEDGPMRAVVPDLPRAASGSEGLPIALVGGPLWAGRDALNVCLEQAGGQIALDATEGGEISLPAPFDSALLCRDPLDALVEAYFGGIPAVFRRPNEGIYQWLGPRMERRGIRGLILLYVVWCDFWHAEIGRMRDWAPVPLLSVTLNGAGEFDRSAAMRIEAFVESLR